MEQSVIQRLIQDYGPVKWVDKSIFGFRDEGWFLIETIPLPPDDELEKVVSDIIDDNEISYDEGKVRHWPECKYSHAIKNKTVKDIIENLEYQKFRIAVCAHSEKDFLDGQPIVIGLNPSITYMDYPDHPHINTGGHTREGVYIPDSFCYGYNPNIYGPSEYERYIKVFDESTLWLLRHQIWEATRNRFNEGDWVGKHFKGGLPSGWYALYLNPLDQCRCGSKKIYKLCHMQSDIRDGISYFAKKQKKDKKATEIELLRKLSIPWHKRVGEPQREMISKLNAILK